MPKPAARSSLNWTLRMHSTLSPANKSWPVPTHNSHLCPAGSIGAMERLRTCSSAAQSCSLRVESSKETLSALFCLPLQCSRLPLSFSKAAWTSPPSTLMMASLLAMWAQSRLLSVLCNNVRLTSASTLTSINVRLSASARSQLPNLSPTSLTTSCALPMAQAASIATSSC